MDRKDFIYVYIWEELNTIYIGRTIDPKRRHRQHRSKEKEKTYQFSSKYGIEHPPMIILEENLSIEKGVEREKYWIEYYKENKQYKVLNKSNGGELGSLGESNEEKRKKYLKEYYQKNKEKYIERGKKYRKEHAEEVREKNRIRSLKRYYKSHKPYKPLSEEEKRLKRKEYYQKNKEKIKEYCYNNKDKIKAYQKEYQKKYRQEHKKEILDYKKKYREKHKLS